jgi:hypothetical protein
VAKVLPPLRVGEPPSYSSISRRHIDRPTCWRVSLNDRDIGWAATKAVRRPDGITELYSRVYLSELPLGEIAPPWLAGVLRNLLRDFGPLDIDKASCLTIDPLGRLVGMDAKVRIADVPDAIKVVGRVEGSTLNLTIHSGGASRELEQYLPPDALMTDELAPQATMPGLRVGQTWTVPLYSPFRPSSQPMDILQAAVEREDRLTWNDRPVPCRIIAYRNDSGSGLANDQARGKVWVSHEGEVLRQEISIFRSRVRFVRLADGQANEIATALGQDWMANLPAPVVRQLMGAVTSPAD